MEVFSFIIKVAKLFSRKDIVYILSILIFVFFSSFLEILSISLVWPLFNFLFEKPINSEFDIILNLVNDLSDFITFDKKLVFATLVCFILTISFFIKLFYIYLNEKFAEKFSNKIVYEMYEKVFKASFEWTRYRSSTNIMQKIVQDGGSIGQATVSSVIELIYQVCLGLAGFIAIILISKNETILIILSAVLVFIILISLISPILQKLSEKQRFNQIDVVEKSSEFFRGIRFIKSNNLENYATSISKNIYSKANRARRQLTIITKIFPGIILLSGQFLIILLIVNLVMGTDTKVNDFIDLSVIGLILLRLMPAVSSVSSSYNRLVKLVPYFKSYDSLKKSVVDKNEKQINSSNLERKFKKWKVLKISRLSYNLENKIILKNVNLKFERNKIYGLVGKSGIGKTTLMDLISCLLNPLEGKIVLDNSTLTEQTKKQWIKEVGYASQDPLIFDKSLEDNIFLNFDNQKISDSLIKRIIKIVNLESIDKGFKTNLNLGEQGINISGGQRQRIGIARAISKSPTLLILDEATSGMDRDLETKIRYNLKKFSTKPTIIIISHNLETLKKCDSIIFFKNYENLRVAKYKELLNDKEFKLLLNN